MTGKGSRGTKWCKTGIWLFAVGVLLIIAGLAGAGFDLLSPMASFSAFGFGALLLAPTAIITVIGLAISLGTAGNASALVSWSALILSIIIIGTALSLRPNVMTATGEPPPGIHDLTTDIELSLIHI